MEGLSLIGRIGFDRVGGLPVVLLVSLLTAVPCHAEIRIIVPVRTCDADAKELNRRYAETFPEGAKGDLLSAALSRVAFDRARCLEAGARFDEQRGLRVREIGSAEAEIAAFPARYPACGVLTEPGKTSVAVMSYPVGINGKLFGDIALINLFATKGDSPEQFHRLILHEWIHGFKTQRVNEPDDISNLLFFEGQATFGVMKVSPELSGMSIESSLEIPPLRLTEALGLLCGLPWTAKQFQGLIPELFVGNNEAFAQPRMGYLLGAKIIERLDRTRSWCEIDLLYFRQHYEEILGVLRTEYCAAYGENK